LIIFNKGINLMPVYFKNTSHSIMIGKDPIEKMGGEEKVTFSMYGDNIPLSQNIPEVGTVLVELVNDQTIFYHDVQMPDVEVDIPVDGNYEVYCVGAGGGSATLHTGSSTKTYRQATGGSGSGFIGIVNLTKGKYIAHIGKRGGSKYLSGDSNSYAAGYAGGDSYLMKDDIKLITAFGGGGGVRNTKTTGVGGDGGTLPQINPSINVISTILNTKGNNGTAATVYSSSASSLRAGASVYNGHGVGTGLTVYSNGLSGSVWGSAGYLKIIYMGK
jgi:hypothetical protein